MKQEPLCFTPVSNLTYIAPQGQFYVCQISPGTPLIRKNVPQK